MIPVLFSLFDSFSETLGDLAFVIKLMALVYIIYVLYITFAENQVIFGGAALMVSYLILFHSPIVLVLALLVFVAINPFFLQNLFFGLQSVQQIEQLHQEEMHHHRFATVQQSIERGEALNPDDLAWYQQMQGGAQGGMAPNQMQAMNNQMYSQNMMSNMMRRGR